MSGATQPAHPGLPAGGDMHQGLLLATGLSREDAGEPMEDVEDEIDVDDDDDDDDDSPETGTSPGRALVDDMFTFGR